MTERDDLISYIWDAYKDANGIRPRWMDFASMSIEDLRETADRLSDEIGRQIREREEHAAEVKAAMLDPDAIVILDPSWAGEDDQYYLEQAIKYGDYSMYSVYRPTTAPASNAMAEAFTNARKR